MFYLLLEHLLLEPDVLQPQVAVLLLQVPDQRRPSGRGLDVVVGTGRGVSGGSGLVWGWLGWALGQGLAGSGA